MGGGSRPSTRIDVFPFTRKSYELCDYPYHILYIYENGMNLTQTFYYDWYRLEANIVRMDDVNYVHYIFEFSMIKLTAIPFLGPIKIFQKYQRGVRMNSSNDSASGA
eukprot:scaffold2968_cov172-Amphora_coffeaeformis.AAC.5